MAKSLLSFIVSVLLVSTFVSSRSLPVHVVETHDVALQYWIRAVDDGHLLRGATLVHFDSHPDMALPHVSINRTWPTSPAQLEMESVIDQSSFIIPALYCGLVKTMVWVKPEWSDQFPDTPKGGRRAVLGQTKERLININLHNEYYKGDDLSSKENKLTDTVPFTLHVVPLSALKTEGLWDAIGESQPGNKSWILDIDEDMLATKSASMGVLEYLLRDVTSIKNLMRSFDKVNICSRHTQKHKSYKEAVKSYEKRLRSKTDLYRVRDVLAGMYGDHGDVFCDAASLIALYEALMSGGFMARVRGDTHRAATEKDESMAIKAVIMVLQDGMELPYNPDTPRVQVHGMMHLAMQSLEGTPSLITVSRSVSDGFLPSSRWREVEWSVMDSLKRRYGPLDVSRRHAWPQGPASDRHDAAAQLLASADDIGILGVLDKARELFEHFHEDDE